MTKYAIYLNTVLPVRAEASEASEMVTQLLFGETCEILEKAETFSKIRNTDDRYEGWVDSKMLTEIDENTYQQINDAPVFRTCVPVADTFCLTDKSVYHLSAGSRLPLFDVNSNCCDIAGMRFQIHPSFITYLPESNKDNIISSATLFLNTPYLWGGKHILGIDCSGFTQIVYTLNGYNIPRDASMQVTIGNTIDSIEDASIGDLLFFEKSGKITHVGIYMGEERIIHASGKVRIDKVDKKGIFNTDLNDYTHTLATIKRI